MHSTLQHYSTLQYTNVAYFNINTIILDKHTPALAAYRHTCGCCEHTNNHSHLPAASDDVHGCKAHLCTLQVQLEVVEELLHVITDPAGSA